MKIKETRYCALYFYTIKDRLANKQIALNGANYSRMYHVKFLENSL